MLCSSTNNGDPSGHHYGPPGYLPHHPSYAALRDFSAPTSYHPHETSNFVQDHSIHSSYPPPGALHQHQGHHHPAVASSSSAVGPKKFWDPSQPNPQPAQDQQPQQQQQSNSKLAPKPSTSQRNRAARSASAAAAKKRKRVATVAQRRAANIRERRRMFNLNEAFDKLRRKVPTFAYEKRLSRIETLRLAITYIGFMDQVIRSESKSGSSNSNIKSCSASQVPLPGPDGDTPADNTNYRDSPW